MQRLFLPTAAAIMLALLTGCFPYPEVRWLVSPMTGEVTSGGRPASGVKITRHYNSAWYEQVQDQITQTDPDGTFKLPGVWKPSVITFIHQPVIDIEISAEKNGRKTMLLQQTKMNYDKRGELDPYSKPSEDSIGTLSKKNGKVHLRADIP